MEKGQNHNRIASSFHTFFFSCVRATLIIIVHIDMQVSYTVPPFSTDDYVREKKIPIKEEEEEGEKKRNKNKQHTHTYILNTFRSFFFLSVLI